MRSLLFVLTMATNSCAVEAVPTPPDAPKDMVATASTFTELELDLLSRVVCAECKGCSSQERVAIAHVAMNRASQPRWWGDGLVDVLTKPSQFATSQSPLCGQSLPARQDGVEWSQGWVEKHRDIMSQIRFESRMVLEGERGDPTGGAVYFHARRLGNIWDHLEEVSVPADFRHRFFKEVE